MHYRIGTRGSKLALVQTEYVKRRMEEAYPEDTFELVIIKTTGDKVTDKPLAAIGTKGLFVKEIEEELLSGSIDMAVHSMKDMPAECETGLTFAKAWKREDCRDVLILKTAGSFSELPSGAVIGTGSLRRACQLAMLRPDIQFTAIRGNVDTRINKLMDDSNGLDGIVLAAAGLNRLGRSSEITEYLDPEVVIPAPAQGVLAIETAEVNTELLDKINALSDDNSDREAVAERLSVKYGKLWVAAEVFLFVLVGATVNIEYLGKIGAKAFVVIIGALIFRMFGVFVCLLGTGLKRKERLFAMVAYTPKATVQAAIGGIPLALGFACGDTVLTMAVLAIVLTAPLGAFAIDLSYKKLLNKQ